MQDVVLGGSAGSALAFSAGASSSSMASSPAAEVSPGACAIEGTIPTIAVAILGLRVCVGSLYQLCGLRVEPRSPALLTRSRLRLR
eukprot:2302699-Pleurochrysis_carterae.AAC.1